jgi:organic hydroperoxide reductase OsmC/OhrA
MAEHSAEIAWERGDQDFVSNRYSRKHVLRFDGGAEVPGSASPHVVPPPMSDASAVDPEEMLIASISACHMLWFLALAAKQRFVVDRYVDKSVGVMAKNAEGRMAVTVVTLRPDVTFSGERLPTRADIDHLHHAAHDACFIANSVKSEIRCEPVYPT